MDHVCTMLVVAERWGGGTYSAVQRCPWCRRTVVSGTALSVAPPIPTGARR